MAARAAAAWLFCSIVFPRAARECVKNMPQNFAEKRQAPRTHGCILHFAHFCSQISVVV